MGKNSPSAAAERSPLRRALDAPVTVALMVASRLARRREEVPLPEGVQVGRGIPRVAPAASGEAPSGLKGRIQRVADRFPPLARAVQVQDRFGEINGGHLAAAVTLQAFLSLFPLILVGIAVLVFVSAHSGSDLADRLVDQLALSGEAARLVEGAINTAEDSRQAATVVGLVGLAWSGLGLVSAIQHAYDQAWQVQGAGWRDKARGLAWLAGAGVLFVSLAAATTALRWLPGWLAPAGILVALAGNFALWLWTSRALPNRRVEWRFLVPGAILGAIGFEALKLAGAYYVPRAVASSSELYGSLGVVFALLAWLVLFARLVVYSAVLDVILYERHQGTVTAVVEVPRLAEPAA